VKIHLTENEKKLCLLWSFVGELLLISNPDEKVKTILIRKGGEKNGKRICAF
jgi:hypothetical protein